jgi:hypothetical protein
MTADATVTWLDELTSAVRLHARGRAGLADVQAMVERVGADSRDSGETPAQQMVRMLLVVAGQAISDHGHNRELYDSAKNLLAQCDQRVLDSMGAPGILRVYDEVMNAAVSINAVRDARRRHFGS